MILLFSNFTGKPFTLRTLFYGLSVFLFCCSGPLFGQDPDCSFSISGYLRGEHDGEALGFATVFAEGPALGVQADSTGYFELENMCAGAQILRFSHIGCDSKVLRLELRRDTLLNVFLHHHDNYVQTVTITAAATASYDDQLDARATGQLSDVLEKISGISSLRTGTAAAKPIYDGVFGNRLSLQNNGLAQSGQQWGNDHAPEIDPWIAAYVRVIDGVEALRYAGPTVAATVLIEPAELRLDDLPGGKVAYGFQSNGRGHTLNTRYGSQFDRTAYRLSATAKLFGDQQAPDYYLRNTGRREGNAALQIARFHRDERWISRLYYSLFNAEIGVLRGAHVGNLTDLQRAIAREQPFFTEPEFSYRIDAPRQRVIHHLIKAETEFRPDDNNRLWLRYGGQLNDRREYDVRRGGRSEKPALSLEQFDHQGEAGWHRELNATDHLDAVVQLGQTINDNQPGTGILPLIPDYTSWRVSGFVAYHREADRVQYHGGLRFDLRDYFVQTISRTPPSQVVAYNHRFGVVGTSLEIRYRLDARFSMTLGGTYRGRAPEVNELHSFGLHQGVSGIEEGDTSLQPEHSVKLQIGALYASDRQSLSVGIFYQPVQNYIFLEPQPDFRLTIRGAFPVFIYRSNDALLYGLKAQWRFQAGTQWEFETQLAMVRGHNRTNNSPLVYVPPDNLRIATRYHPSQWGQGWMLGMEGYLSMRQERLDPEQDFLPPLRAMRCSMR